MRAKWIVMFGILLVIVLIAGAPLISVIVASWVAESHGCTLHEGFVNPCIVDGEDMGETLYQMFVMGWFMLVTIPAGLVAIVVWAVVAIGMVVAGRRRAAPPPKAEA
jgi:hypothetical protein